MAGVVITILAVRQVMVLVTLKRRIIMECEHILILDENKKNYKCSKCGKYFIEINNPSNRPETTFAQAYIMVQEGLVKKSEVKDKFAHLPEDDIEYSPRLQSSASQRQVLVRMLCHKSRTIN